MHMLQNGGNMPDQKLDNLLNLALDATEEEREKSRNLNVGYEKQTRKWEIIVKYSEMGDSVEALLGGSGISVVPLLGGYAIVTLPESMLEEYSRRPQIEFIEKPTRLYFEDLFSKEASCITQELWIPGWITGILHFLQQMESPGFCVCGIRAFPVIPRRAMQQELNIPMRKSMRRCPSLCRRGGALFRLKMEAVMEPLCLEWQLAAIFPVGQ